MLWGIWTMAETPLAHTRSYWSQNSHEVGGLRCFRKRSGVGTDGGGGFAGDAREGGQGVTAQPTDDERGGEGVAGAHGITNDRGYTRLIDDLVCRNEQCSGRAARERNKIEVVADEQRAEGGGGV